MKFNSPETYLAARNEWRKAYAQLSVDIRKAKVARKEADRKLATFKGKAFYASLEKVTAYSDMLATIWELQKLKKQARLMFEELAEAKQEAQRQYVTLKGAK